MTGVPGVPEIKRSITVELRDGLALVGLNRPEQLNALDVQTVAEFHQALDLIEDEPRVLVIHSTTAGIFASGAHLRELLHRRSDDALRRINIRLFDRIAQHRWPSIAVIDGPAFGAGCELAIACDFRVCSPRAVFAQPEARLGVLAGAGGNWRLRDLIGLERARRMLLLGERFTAADALDAGLATKVSDTAEPLEAAIELAATIASASWRSLELTKLALAQSSMNTTAFDSVAQALLFEGEDKTERISAFLHRRREPTTEGPTPS